jgi:glucokinase
MVEPNRQAAYAVGVDLGGQNVRAAVVNRDEKIVGHARGPSDAKKGVAQVIRRTVAVVNEAIVSAGLTREQVAAVGLAVPGHIDPRTGVIHWSPNFGEETDGKFEIFLEVPFAGPVSESLGLACFAGNDANVAALGEFRYGAGREVDDLVMFTLGTGIGGGVVSGGRLVTGSTGGAVELGHHIIVANGQQCGCGSFGCMEAYCGTDAIVERAMRVLEQNHESILSDGSKGDKTTLKPLDIDEAARRGDRCALQVWEETGYYLGVGIANAINLFNPDAVVLGGGIRSATGLIAAAERAMRRHAIYSLHKTCKIFEATLGEDAGVMGAAELAWLGARG